MDWKVYQVVLRLRSPIHIGQMKLGNIQRTRRYVTGRSLWGALTMRLARDTVPQGKPATAPHLYETMGRQVQQQLTFTYLYPTTHQDGTVDLWPWDESFGSRFLSTYAGTALNYPHQSAAEGTLHEVECIVPHTLDDCCCPVYLTGYVFAQEDAPDWKSALNRLQLGGERGYGWGRVELENLEEWDTGRPLFGWYTVLPNIWPPVLKAVLNATKQPRLVAHALACDYDDRGSVHRTVEGVDGSEGFIEPLVGRETGSYGRFGMRVSQARICYTPGSLVTGEDFACCIGPYGIWEATST